MSELPPQSYLEAALRQMPAFMRGPTFDKLWTSTFGMFDLVVGLARDAALQASIDHCADDAVPYHASARLIEPITGESVDALRERVKNAWTFWSELGPTEGLQNALREYVQEENLYVFDEANDGWFSNGIGEAFGDDTNADNASRHVIVIEQPHRWERPIVGPDLIVGPGLMVGITMSSSELSLIRRIYRKHRPAHMVGADIYIIFDSTTAADVLANHDASSDFVRIPLHVSMVGYSSHGMVVGSALKVGREFK